MDSIPTDDFLISSTLFLFLLGYFSNFAEYYLGLIWRNLAKSSRKYGNMSQEKKFVKFCVMFNNNRTDYISRYIFLINWKKIHIIPIILPL